MSNWDDWEEAAEKDISEVKITTVGEEDEKAVPLEAEEYKVQQSKPKNAEKVSIHFFHPIL